MLDSFSKSGRSERRFSPALGKVSLKEKWMINENTKRKNLVKITLGTFIVCLPCVYSTFCKSPMWEFIYSYSYSMLLGGCSKRSSFAPEVKNVSWIELSAVSGHITWTDSGRISGHLWEPPVKRHHFMPLHLLHLEIWTWKHVCWATAATLKLYVSSLLKMQSAERKAELEIKKLLPSWSHPLSLGMSTVCRTHAELFDYMNQ